MRLTDWRGNEFGVGDIIIYSTVSGSSPVATEAEVVEIEPREKNWKTPSGVRLKVRPIRTTGWRDKKEFVYLTHLKTIIKIEDRSGLAQTYEDTEWEDRLEFERRMP
jgi:hypothetical protein